MKHTHVATPCVTRWSDGLTPMHWRILFASFLGWIFDGFEALALVLVMGPMLHSLLSPEQAASSSLYAGILLGTTLLGWGIGGITGGVLADYLGRKKIMLWSVFLYALFSGLTGFSTTFWVACLLRFITGVAMGSEWSTGIALVSETWPERARAKGAGFLQSGYGWGTLIAAALWFVLSAHNPLADQTWRLMFFIGALPALLVLYLRRGVSESEKWKEAIKQQRWAAIEVSKPGAAEQSAGKRPFPLKQLFSDPATRRLTLLALSLSMVTSIGWWAIATWLPVQTVALARAQGLPDAASWAAKVSIAYTTGAIIAYLVSGFVIDVIGRRLFISLSFAGCLVMTIVSYKLVSSAQTLLLVAPLNGFFTLGCAYVWLAIYPAELYATSVRASAISFIFNGSRIVAWVFPIIAGSMIESFGGVSQAAMTLGSIYLLGIVLPWFMPETRGRALPQ
jgi:MFS family permease